MTEGPLTLKVVFETGLSVSAADFTKGAPETGCGDATGVDREFANGTIGSIGVFRTGAFLEVNRVEFAKGCMVVSLPEGATGDDNDGASSASTTGSIGGDSKFDAGGVVLGPPTKLGVTIGAPPGATAGVNTGAEGCETGDVVATGGESARSGCFVDGRVVGGLPPNDCEDPCLSE